MSTTYTGTFTLRTPKVINKYNLPRGEYEVMLTDHGKEISWRVTKCPSGVPHISVVGAAVRSSSSNWSPSLPDEVKQRYLNKGKNKR